MQIHLYVTCILTCHDFPRFLSGDSQLGGIGVALKGRHLLLSVLQNAAGQWWSASAWRVGVTWSGMCWWSKNRPKRGFWSWPTLSVWDVSSKSLWQWSPQLVWVGSVISSNMRVRGGGWPECGGGGRRRRRRRRRRGSWWCWWCHRACCVWCVWRFWCCDVFDALARRSDLGVCRNCNPTEMAP